MARPVDYRKARGSKGVHTEDEQVPRGKTDQGRQSPAFNRDRGAPNAGARAAAEPRAERGADRGAADPRADHGKHAAGHEGQQSARKTAKKSK